MDQKDLLDRLAPCGLDCSRCYAFSGGDISVLSQKLGQLLGDFERYARRFSDNLPIFTHFPSFKLLLDYLARADCLGCRRESCGHPLCVVKNCHKEKSVAYCFQCTEFPCEKTGFSTELKQRWIQMNCRMKEIGIEAYHEETKKLPRYC